MPPVFLKFREAAIADAVCEAVCDRTADVEYELTPREYDDMRERLAERVFAALAPVLREDGSMWISVNPRTGEVSLAPIDTAPAN